MPALNSYESQVLCLIVIKLISQIVSNLIVTNFITQILRNLINQQALLFLSMG